MTMKKMAMLLCTLLLAVTFAFADTMQPLKADEVTEFNKNLLKKALSDGAKLAEEDGAFKVDGKGYTLYIKENALNENSTVTEAIIDNESIELMNLNGPRGSFVGQSVSDTLKLFENDNESLSGTDSEAVLYIQGSLPAQVNTASLIRHGQSILLIEYTSYQQVGEKVNKTGFLFTVENDAVTAIQSFLQEGMDAKEAEKELVRLSSLQEEKSYFAFDTQNPQPLQREDLRFDGLDFVDLSEEELQAKLGKATTIEKVPDNDGKTFDKYHYENLNVLFLEGKAISVVINDYFEGPRGLRTGENLNNVLRRFPNEAKTLNTDTVLLYGDENDVTVPSASLVNDGDRSMLYIRVPVKDATAVVTAEFVNEELEVISLGYISE